MLTSVLILWMLTNVTTNKIKHNNHNPHPLVFSRILFVVNVLLVEGTQCIVYVTTCFYKKKNT